MRRTPAPSNRVDQMQIRHTPAPARRVDQLQPPSRPLAPARRVDQTQLPSRICSGGSSPALAPGAARTSMESGWTDIGSEDQPFHEVVYTPTIDFGDDTIDPVHQSNMENIENSIPPISNMATEDNSMSMSRGNEKRGTGRTKNFSIKEDEILCSAYLNISKDPIVGVNQPTGGYWARITDYFNQFMTPPKGRSLSALQHRWGAIQRDTSRFSGFFAEMERKNQSGKNEDDKIKDALQMYEGVAGSRFPYMHCWLILRHEMKWTSWLAALSAREEPDPVEGQKGSDEGHVPPPRPIGRDKAKKLRSSSSSSSSTACLEVLQKMSMDRTAYEERQDQLTKDEAEQIAARSERKLAALEMNVQIQKEMLELQKEEQINKIMMLDVDKMAPWVRDYYIDKQKKIAQRSLNEDGSSGPSGT